LGGFEGNRCRRAAFGANGFERLALGAVAAAIAAASPVTAAAAATAAASALGFPLITAIPAAFRLIRKAALGVSSLIVRRMSKFPIAIGAHKRFVHECHEGLLQLQVWAEFRREGYH
jgi:hypothetical protein